MRPAAVSARKTRPGCSRPLRITVVSGSESMSSTPTSLASTTRPSLVTQYRPGRRPLRSSTAPITEPSVNAISAGPSHGSMSAAWYR
jgi:hypothetical protein